MKRKALCVLIAILMFSGVPLACATVTISEPGRPQEITVALDELISEFEQIRELAIENEVDLFELKELIDLNYQMIQSVNTAIGFTNAQMRQDTEQINAINAEYLEYIDLIGSHFMDVDADLVGLNEQVTGLRRLQAPMIGAVLVCIGLSCLTLYRLDQLMKK